MIPHAALVSDKFFFFFFFVNLLAFLLESFL